MKPYKHEDDNGNEMTIDFGGFYAEVAVESADGPFRVFPESVSKIAGELYEACGLPVPVILERPAPREMLAAGPHGDEVVHVEPSPAGHPSNRPGVVLELGSQSVRLIGDEPLRVALALVDAMREAEPDPAEVEELAHAIRIGLFPGSDRVGLGVGESDREAARAALRWMNAKAARDDA